MSNVTSIEKAEALADQGQGRIIGYQVGTVYPGFNGASREALADVFHAHGFDEQAERLRDIDAERALAHVVSRVGRARRDGIRVDPLEADSADSHVRAWGVYLVERRPGERASTFRIGARVFVAVDQIYAASPVDAPEIRECRELAEQIAAEARECLVSADTATASKAVIGATRSAGALPFIASGTYVAPVAFAKTADLVALIGDLRTRFYDEAKRAGLRCSAVAIVERDAASVSDAVLDDLQARLAQAAAALRAEVADGKIRASTIERRRAEIQSLADDARARQAWLGGWSSGLDEGIASLASAYAAAHDATSLAFPPELAAIADGGSAPIPAAPERPTEEPAPPIVPAATVAVAPPSPPPAAPPPPAKGDVFDY